MTDNDTLHEVFPPTPATALLVDLRNFTPNLNAEPQESSEGFYSFLAAFYATCLDSCRVAFRRVSGIHIPSTLAPRATGSLSSTPISTMPAMGSWRLSC